MGSYYDFIADYGRDIKQLLNKAKTEAIRISKEAEGKPEGTYEQLVGAKLKSVENVYDKPVVEFIEELLASAGDHFHYEVKDVADIALNINNHYGTEMRQVVNALEDVFGYVNSGDEIDEKKKEIQPESGESKCKICGKPSDPQWSAEDGEYCSKECLMTYSEELTENKSIHDLYDILNNLDGATYVESEGQNCIRVDFDNGGSIWFDEYPGDKSIRGNAGQYNSQVKQIAKKYGFTIGRLEEQVNEEHFTKFNESILENFTQKIDSIVEIDGLFINSLNEAKEVKIDSLQKGDIIIDPNGADFYVHWARINKRNTGVEIFGCKLDKLRDIENNKEFSNWKFKGIDRVSRIVNRASTTLQNRFEKAFRAQGEKKEQKLDAVNPSPEIVR